MPVKWLMLLAVAVGAGVAGFAGTINGAYYQGVFPDTFTFPLLITVYAMVDPRRRREPRGRRLRRGRRERPARGAAHARPRALGLLRGDPARPARQAAAVAAARRRARRARRVRRRRQPDRRRDLAASGVHGPIATGPTSFTTHGFLATRHPPLARPAGEHVRGAATTRIGNYAFVLVIALVLTLHRAQGLEALGAARPDALGAPPSSGRTA